MILIRNMRFEKPDKNKPWQVRVDRASILGNPYRMEREVDRIKVCESYRKWFYESLVTGSDFSREIDRLCLLYRTYGQLELFCWCYPRKCHAETIRDHILRLVNGSFE